MDKINVRIDGDDFWIEGGDFEDMLDVVRDIPGRSFDAQDKVWILPVDVQIVTKAVQPYSLMYRDDDPRSDSRPIEVMPS